MYSKVSKKQETAELISEHLLRYQIRDKITKRKKNVSCHHHHHHLHEQSLVIFGYNSPDARLSLLGFQGLSQISMSEGS